MSKLCCVSRGPARTGTGSYPVMASIEERIAALLTQLDELRGLIPKHYKHTFSEAGISLSHSIYASAPLRPQCSALVKGRPCKNRCSLGIDMCMIHQKAAERTKPSKLRCSAMTLKGTQCRCKVFKSFDMCRIHATFEGLVPEKPTECAICYEEMNAKNRKETSCGHYFHTACLRTYAISRSGFHMTPRGKYELSGPCPMCRAPFKMRVPALE